MEINITSRNFKISPELSEIIRNKLSNLIKYDNKISRVDVVLLKESRAEKMEAKVTSKKNIYLVKCYTSVFEKTLSKLYKNLIIQIQKKKK